MCTVCQEVEGLTPNEALKVIARVMEDPNHDAQHISELLDRVLDIGQEQYDQELAEAWERERRVDDADV